MTKKADELVNFGEVEETYTYFEMLEKRVELLQEMVEEMSEILEQNNLKNTKITSPPKFDTDRMFEELEEDSGPEED